MCPSYFCWFRVTSPSSQSHLTFFRVRVVSWLGRVESQGSSHFESLVCRARFNVESTDFSHFFYDFFMLWNGVKHAINWRPIRYKMVPNMLLLQSEIPSGICAKLRTVAASNNRDHASNLSYNCLLVLHIWWCYSSHTSRSWWITQSTQHHRSGCNTMKWQPGS